MRIRIRFAKLGKIRFTSQRDVARMWERALRRASLPLAYSEGFSPRPQLSFGLALPTGCESLAEYLDVVLDDRRPETAVLDVTALPTLLTGLLPEGLDVEVAVPVEPRAESLQQQVTSCSWTMGVHGVSRDELESLVASVLRATSVPIVRERKGRQEQDDLRPSVLALAVADGPSSENRGHHRGRAGRPGGGVGHPTPGGSTCRTDPGPHRRLRIFRGRPAGRSGRWADQGNPGPRPGL